MNLVSFLGQTGGGLTCSWLNNSDSPMTGYTVANFEHSAFKLPQGLDATLVDSWWRTQMLTHYDSSNWFGTHAHPSVIPELSRFDRVVVITVTTRQSKLLRWLRWYYGWLGTNANLARTEDNSLNVIDHARCFAKLNTFDEFATCSNCINIEFEELVNGTACIADLKIKNCAYYSAWRTANAFLYSQPNSWAIDRFNEAEWELQNNMQYQYI